MDIKDYEDGKLIILSSAFGSRGKALYFCYFLMFFISATAFLRLLLVNSFSPIAGAIVCILGLTAFYIAAYRFIRKSSMSERLFVNKQVLKIINKSIFGSLVKTYKIGDISNFRHLAKPELTNHPLSGQTFDYLGFQTEQRVINEMHGDNRLAFDWKGTTVIFGQDIYSWDFEALEVLLYDITGNDLRYEDEFEKTFHPSE